jgi:hypothetical protein
VSGSTPGSKAKTIASIPKSEARRGIIRYHPATAVVAAPVIRDDTLLSTPTAVTTADDIFLRKA